MHGVLRAALAEDPVAAGGDGNAPGAGGGVAQDDERELDGIGDGDVDGGFAGQAVFGVFEDGVAVAVAADGGGAAGGGARRGGPDAAGFVVAEVEVLAGGIGDGVVVPGGEAELVGVLRPGIGAAGFADDGAEGGVG